MRYQSQEITLNQLVDFESAYYNLKAKVREVTQEIEKLKIAAEFDMDCG